MQLQCYFYVSFLEAGYIQSLILSKSCIQTLLFKLDIVPSEYQFPIILFLKFIIAIVSQSPTPKPSKYSRKAVRENVNTYVFTRYFDRVKNYDSVLEKNFPSAMHVYRVFLDGVKDFFKDMKRFLKITRIISGSAYGLRALTRGELELYYQMPRDMVKVAPAIFFSTLPIVGYAVLPLASVIFIYKYFRNISFLLVICIPGHFLHHIFGHYNRNLSFNNFT